MKMRFSRSGVRGALAVALAAAAAVALTVPVAPVHATDSSRRATSAESLAKVAANPDKEGQRPDPSRVPGELLVRFANRVSAAKRGAVRSGVGATLERKLVRGLEVLKVDSGVNGVAEALERRPEVLYAEPNFVYSIASAPDDPKLPQLWGLQNTGQVVDGQAGTADADIDAPEAWDNATGDASVTVAVVDTGIAYDHPDLAPNAWTNPGETTNGIDDDGNGYVDDVRGWDWPAGDNDPQDANGHGTHVAGTIGAAANDGIGITGVAWDVSLMPRRVLAADGSGTLADIVAGFAYAGAEGADVVNASLGGPEYSQAMEDVIAGSPQTLFVVAAGNGTEDTDAHPTYPCSFPATNLVCVAATDNQDRLADFSNYGAESVDLAAPGVGIVSTVPPWTTVLSDGFEGAWSERWFTGGSRAWGIESSPTHGQFLTDSPYVTYAPNANTWVRPRSTVNLAGLKNCTLEYMLALDTEEGYDGLLVEAAPAGGYYSRVAEWTGSSGGWVRMQDSLAEFEGVGEVYLRFRLISDGSIQRSGASVDDVAVRCRASTYSGDEYESQDGTSMASPHVAGAAALLFAAAPGVDVSTVRSALLGGVEAQPTLVGATSTGGRLNISDSLDRLVSMVRFSNASPSVGESGDVATVAIRRTGDVDMPASVAYQTSQGTATAGSDYTPATGSLSFAAGQTTASFTVPIIDDDVFEGGETVDLTLTSPNGVPLGAPSTSTLTIRDDDSAAVVSFAQPTRPVAENAGAVEVTVSRTGNLQAPAEVEYSRTSGSAAPGADFSLSAGTVAFAAGQRTASFTVPIINDSAREPAESVVLTLASRRPDTTLGTISAMKLTIAASDQQPDAWISTARASGYVGNNVYNATGGRQSRTLQARRAQTRAFYVRIFNDGNATTTVAVKGSSAQAGSALRYFDGATDVTRAMRSAAGWKVRLAPGRYRLVTCRVKIVSGAAIGSLRTAWISGTWTGDGVRTDVSRAVVRVVQ
jgi:subtilisin family serine protease